ncbi:N1R/p28-like protein [Choristoneura rosaceana entomopoxvirus 'L']|uniref:N1R/p28-like protein n=1 Tax=Choristoneura rosaceana entomopoxvirus 'L' TaxID=1293539 RepID=A0ABM9QKB7_9POXV|nr:N1R/p28-like protein [Choristoneura rosaceana entomopoxvirus 'L']CCU55987.1 N1R/p28-like protein [Choristoneura rosaceana entomopoxvirus 'L']
MTRPKTYYATKLCSLGGKRFSNWSQNTKSMELINFFKQKILITGNPAMRIGTYVCEDLILMKLIKILKKIIKIYLMKTLNYIIQIKKMEIKYNNVFLNNSKINHIIELFNKLKEEQYNY